MDDEKLNCPNCGMLTLKRGDVKCSVCKATIFIDENNKVSFNDPSFYPMIHFILTIIYLIINCILILICPANSIDELYIMLIISPIVGMLIYFQFRIPFGLGTWKMSHKFALLFVIFSLDLIFLAILTYAIFKI
jgi:hypothetical protein